jgi:CRISPR-associated endonuclease Cas3-HD
VAATVPDVLKSDVPDDRALGVLWGKSDAGGSMNLLLQHLFDTAAVAELMRDRFLAPAVTSRIDDCCPGNGRALFSMICGLHDVGKASPAFQAKHAALGAAVREDPRQPSGHAPGAAETGAFTRLTCGFRHATL